MRAPRPTRPINVAVILNAAARPPARARRRMRLDDINVAEAAQVISDALDRRQLQEQATSHSVENIAHFRELRARRERAVRDAARAAAAIYQSARQQLLTLPPWARAQVAARLSAEFGTPPRKPGRPPTNQHGLNWWWAREVDFFQQVLQAHYPIVHVTKAWTIKRMASAFDLDETNFCNFLGGRHRPRRPRP